MERIGGLVHRELFVELELRSEVLIHSHWQQLITSPLSLPLPVNYCPQLQLNP